MILENENFKLALNSALHKTDVTSSAEIESPYFDEKGREIKEFAVIKVWHFKGVNEQGRGRKNYYMYKWVRLTEWKGKRYWTAMHLTNDSGDYYQLRASANSERVLKGVEIVQQY